MNARYPILITFLCISGVLKVNAQIEPIGGTLSKLYFKGAIGGGISMNGEYTPYQTDNTNNNNNAITAFGAGYVAALSIGYQLNPNIGFELNFNYLYGLKNVVVNQQNLMPNGYDLYTDGQVKLPQLSPSVIFSAPLGKLRPYVRLGLNLGIPTFNSEQGSTLINGTYNNGAWEDSKILFHGGYSIGMQTAIGCQIPLKSNKTCLFFEADFNDINYFPTNRSVYAYTINGADQFSTQQTSDKEIVFKNKVEFVQSTPPSQATEQLQYSIPLSGINLQAGIKINIGSKTLPDINPFPQHVFYVRIQAGYGLVTNAERIITMVDTPYQTIALFSGGAGFNFGAGAGYMLSHNFGFDLGVNYIPGQKLDFTNIPNLQGLGYDVGSITGTMLQIIPSVVIATNIGGFQPYARLGFITGSGSVSAVHDNYNAQFDITAHTVWKYQGGISMGYNAVLGIAHPISNQFDVYIEASFNNIYEIPTTANITTNTYNGMDVLDQMAVQDKSIVYKNSYSNADNYDTTKPKIADPVKYNFCAAVINVGVRMRLGNSKK